MHIYTQRVTFRRRCMHTRLKSTRRDTRAIVTTHIVAREEPEVR